MKKRRGFTLVEIMIVILIIVLLGAVSITSWFNITQNICGEGTLFYVVQALENHMIKVRYDSFQRKDVYVLSFNSDSLVISDGTRYTFPDEVTIKNSNLYKYNRGFFTTNSDRITHEASFTLEYNKGNISNEKVFYIVGGLPQSGDY